jgi:flagella basal body P-ring formation protein FlgA
MKRHILITAFAVLGYTAGAAYGGGLEDAAGAAIATAVKARLGAPADVRVENVQARGDLAREFVARVPPGARTGMRTRFALVSADQAGAQVGEAEATIFIAAPHVRAVRPLHRGAAIPPDAVTEEDDDVGSIQIQGLPTAPQLTGATAAREIAQGEVLVASSIAVPAVVRAGDKLVVRAAAGALYVQAVVVAAQPGGLGDVIRCVNPDTRKAMAARIVAPGLAEVLHAY